MKRMKRMSVAAVGLLVLVTSVPMPASATDPSGFLKEVDDLPLAPGLVEQPGGTLFDSPQGRIVEATAQGALLEVEVRQFYDESLPELGWHQVASGVYRRDKEVLRIDYSDGTPMVVHFAVTPFKAGTASSEDKDKGEKQ